MKILIQDAIERKQENKKKLIRNLNMDKFLNEKWIFFSFNLVFIERVF